MGPGWAARAGAGAGRQPGPERISPWRLCGRRRIPEGQRLWFPLVSSLSSAQGWCVPDADCCPAGCPQPAGWEPECGLGRGRRCFDAQQGLPCGSSFWVLVARMLASQVVISPKLLGGFQNAPGGACCVSALCQSVLLCGSSAGPGCAGRWRAPRGHGRRLGGWAVSPGLPHPTEGGAQQVPSCVA